MPALRILHPYPCRSAGRTAAAFRVSLARMVRRVFHACQELTRSLLAARITVVCVPWEATVLLPRHHRPLAPWPTAPPLSAPEIYRSARASRGFTDLTAPCVWETTSARALGSLFRARIRGTRLPVPPWHPTACVHPAQRPTPRGSVYVLLGTLGPPIPAALPVGDVIRAHPTTTAAPVCRSLARP